jgi:hypothetical protein
MTALLAAGAKHVLWLTLHEAREPFPELNRLLERAPARWPQLELVDWNAAAQGHSDDWFQNDYLHLKETGGIAMAHLVHGAVLARLVDRRPPDAVAASDDDERRHRAERLHEVDERGRPLPLEGAAGVGERAADGPLPVDVEPALHDGDRLRVPEHPCGDRVADDQHLRLRTGGREGRDAERRHCRDE